MSRSSLIWTWAVLVAAASGPLVLAQGSINMEILEPTPRPQDANFKLANLTGFSVAYVIPGEYRLFAAGTTQRIKWNSTLNGFNDLFFNTTLCNQQNDPQTWDGRCIDAIGLFWKRIDCQGFIPCQWNGWWNAAPATLNMSLFPEPWLWPRTDDYGSPGYVPIINKDLVNSTDLLPAASTCVTGYPCPPKSGQESRCNPHNPDSYSTGVANAKAVQVYYSGGVNRWFMALNTQIHYEYTYSDKWRIIWAYSDDGTNWTIDPRILFRSAAEANPVGFCGLGFLVTDLFLDTGHFYMTFTDVGSGNVYLARSRIDYPGTTPGYAGTWSIASYPLVNGQWTWLPVKLGVLLDLPAMGAANVMPDPLGGDLVFKVRQSDIGRVFVSSQPNSANRYIGLASDLVNGSPVLQLFSTTSLSVPFQYESSVDLSNINIGGNGLEFAFTQYHDNLPSSPRLVGEQLDFWIIQKQPDPNRPWDVTRNQTVTRKTVQLRGGIYGN